MQRFPGPLPEKRLSSWHLVDVGLLKSRLSEIELASSDHQLVHRAIEEFTQHISQYTSELKHCKFFKDTFYVYVLSCCLLMMLYFSVSDTGRIYRD